MRNLALAVGLLASPLLGGLALAVVPTIDDVPAATLLLPYFEVDPNGTAATGVDTLLSINDASASATMTHVTVWSDLAVPVLSFDVYLTGFDAQTMDMREVLAGRLPRTASAGQDPMDAISNHGVISQDINFASCNGQLPLPAQLDPTFVDHLRASLSGQFSSLIGGCAGRNYGDGLMRGYVTVDVSNQCTIAFPGDSGYFVNGGGGMVGNRNILWGDYLQIDRATRKTYADNLVSIEASVASSELNAPGQYTFYGSRIGWTAADNREPLPSTFAMRFFNAPGAGFPTKTSLIGWRDPKVSQTAFPCSAGAPPWFPLSQEQIVAFDDEENPEEGPSSPVGPPPPGTALIPFPGATQRIRLGSSALPITFDHGWLYLNLGTAVTAAGSNPSEDPNAAQAWVTVIHEDADTAAYGVRGHTSVGYRAIALDNASSANHNDPNP